MVFVFPLFPRAPWRWHVRSLSTSEGNGCDWAVCLKQLHSAASGRYSAVHQLQITPLFTCRRSGSHPRLLCNMTDGQSAQTAKVSVRFKVSDTEWCRTILQQVLLSGLCVCLWTIGERARLCFYICRFSLGIISVVAFDELYSRFNIVQV